MATRSHHKTTSVSGRSVDGGGMAFERADGGTFTVGVDATPGAYLLAAIAGCYESVGRMVATERGLELGEMRVRVAGGVDPRTYRGEAAESRAGYEPIRVEVGVAADLDGVTLDAWLAEVRRRCPVCDNVRNGTETTVTLDRA